MHLSKILEQIKRHPSPTQAIDKLGKSLEKHEGSLLERGFRILKSELCANVYEAINGPHFDEEHAKYAVENMENEDGTRGPHWTVEETTSVANQMGINLRSEKHNKWDWFVAMNMMYSDYYKAVAAMTGNPNTKHFAELAKAWVCDKDIPEGKTWHYYVYLMCQDDEENDYRAIENQRRRSGGYRPYEGMYGRMPEEYEEFEEEEEMFPYARRGRGGRGRSSRAQGGSMRAGSGSGGSSGGSGSGGSRARGRSNRAMEGYEQEFEGEDEEMQEFGGRMPEREYMGRNTSVRYF